MLRHSSTLQLTEPEPRVTLLTVFTSLHHHRHHHSCFGGPVFVRTMN
jgi:hypothetical protein